jgi:hypothetical protein
MFVAMCLVFLPMLGLQAAACGMEAELDSTRQDDFLSRLAGLVAARSR